MVAQEEIKGAMEGLEANIKLLEMKIQTGHEEAEAIKKQAVGKTAAKTRWRLAQTLRRTKALEEVRQQRLETLCTLSNQLLSLEEHTLAIDATSTAANAFIDQLESQGVVPEMEGLPVARKVIAAMKGLEENVRLLNIRIASEMAQAKELKKKEDTQEGKKAQQTRWKLLQHIRRKKVYDNLRQRRLETLCTLSNQLLSMEEHTLAIDATSTAAMAFIDVLEHQRVMPSNASLVEQQVMFANGIPGFAKYIAAFAVGFATAKFLDRS